MSRSPYSSYTSDQLILRDFLAADRTVLANETTLLAYVRTSLAVLAAGAAFLQFFDEVWLDIIGALCIPLAAALLIIGVWRFRQMKAQIDGITREGPKMPPL